jgi:hypothetical protein
MKDNQILKASIDEILAVDFIDITDASRIKEYDIRNVRGSIRLRTGQFISPDEIKSLKAKVKSIKFPSK